MPVVRLRNADRILDDGVSEIDDLMPLIDALNKVLVDMMTTSEYVGRPRRWATGIELEEADALDDDGEPTGETIAVNPIPEGNRAMISENDAAKFGQLEAGPARRIRDRREGHPRSDHGRLGAPGALRRVFTDNPASADALRAAEASLTARAQARQQSFGRAWEDVARLVLGVRDGADPLRVDCRVTWADAATRSIAQEADAITKLYSIGLLPQSFALRKLGYTDDEITEIRTAKRAEALDATAVDLSKLVG